MSPSEYLDAHTEDLSTLLGDLVRVPTVNPPGEHYDAITTRLESELAAVGLRAVRHQIPRPLLEQTLPPALQSFSRWNVLGYLDAPRATRTIHFNAHYDVVPVSGIWSHGHAFSGAVEDGWIYGRGTADMKGSIASLLMALRALRATRTEPAMRVEVSFTADEETDSALGAAWLVKYAPIAPDFVVVMEGGERGKVCCGHNGVVWLDVIVHGQAAHGSRPERGINALEKMSALVVSLDGYRRKLAKRSFASPDEKVMHPTLNIGGVFSQGLGGKVNTVPAEARFSIDRRVLPTENVATAERELRNFLADAARQIGDCRIEIVKISDNHPCYNEPVGPFFSAMAGAIHRVRRARPRFGVSTGFNDMHFFSHHLRVPTLGYGPGGDNEHGLDERASIKELTRCAKVYVELLTGFSG